MGISGNRILPDGLYDDSNYIRVAGDDFPGGFHWHQWGLDTGGLPGRGRRERIDGRRCDF